jgi:hypothetical protein
VWHGAKPPGAELGEQEVADYALKGASPRGSILALFGLLATGLLLSGNLPTQLARFAAWGAGASVAATLLFDFRRGVANLIRADVLALVGLYFLTFFEFLFPQPELDQLTDAASTRGAIIACLWGHAGLIIGRHIKVRGYSMLQELFRKEVPNGWLLLIFGACIFLGHLQMLMAVDWNPFLMVEWFTAPRFSQPWGRGRLGDWKALLYELSMLLFLVPPIAGIVMARRRQFTMPQHWFVAFGLALELFYAFCSGTRNLFISFVVTFLIGYIFALPRGKKRELITVSIVALVVTLAASNFMLKFRSVGLKDWIKGDRPQSEVTDKFIHVDFNLFVISQLVATFPKIHDYLGLEIPYLAIIRPIPRALWPGKPEGMSVSLEAECGRRRGLDSGGELCRRGVRRGRNTHRDVHRDVFWSFHRLVVAPRLAEEFNNWHPDLRDWFLRGGYFDAKLVRVHHSLATDACGDLCGKSLGEAPPRTHGKVAAHASARAATATSSHGRRTAAGAEAVALT